MEKLIRISFVISYILIILSLMSCQDDIELLGVDNKPPDSPAYYVSPKGNDKNPGTFDQPFLTWAKAIEIAKPGDIIYIRGGEYTFNTDKRIAVVIKKSGSESKPICLWAYPNERPILKCSGKNAFGIEMDSSNFWHIKGIEITGIVQLQGYICRGISGRGCSNNIFESIKCYKNAGCGIFLADYSTNNLVKNCDFYDNYDKLNNGGNADGLQIAYIPKGCSNKIYGCRMWNNSDDGLDLWKNEGIIYVENCWAWHNGYVPGTETKSGNGQGFKFGRTDSIKDTKTQRIVRNCLSFFNRVNGYDQNQADVTMEFYNNIAYKNKNFGFFLNDFQNAHVFSQNIAIENANSKQVFLNEEALQQANSWQGSTLSEANFVSLNSEEVYKERKPDGSLPDISFLKLK